MIILTGSLVAICCGLLGCFLILRKMAMVGDAISHAVLPGIVLAYLFSGSRAVLPMLLGAAVLGIFTTIMIEFLYKKAKLQTDASIGITFTWLFAIGVILISYFAGNVDLDQDCVLYGEILFVPLEPSLIIFGLEIGPQTIWVLIATLVIILSFIWKGYKGLFITTFNPEYAVALGISSAFWHYALMALVSVTTVVSFESVGAILVVAFLIVPPATAYLITDDLKKMLALTVLFGILSSFLGYYLAIWIDGSVAAAMVSVAGILFFMVFCFNQFQKSKNKVKISLEMN